MINMSTELVNHPAIQRFVRECPERFTDIQEVAINKAAARIRYLVKREVPNKWGVKKEEMKDFKLKRALRSQGHLTAAAILRGSNIPLFKIQSTAPRTPMVGKTSGGMSTMLAGQSHTFKHSFVAMMKSGYTGVFERAGEKVVPKKGRYYGKLRKDGKPIERQVIKEKFTSSVAGLAASEKTDIPKNIAPMIQEEYENHFVREAEAWLSLLGAK